MRQSIVDPVGVIYGPVQDVTPVDVSLSESINLRLLIHYLGDIHQPLHSVSRYTDKYPEGDMGGNLFLLEPYGPEGINNLHSLWDSVLGTFANDFQQPLDASSWEFLGVNAHDIRFENPRDSFETGELEKPESEWYKETLELSKQYVYTGIEDGGVVTSEYVNSRVGVARRQIAKGGLRLADYLRQIKSEIDAKPT